MTDLPNLALHRPASQSSICMFSKGTSPEDDAIGGNNGVISGGAGFHTGYDLPSWWSVDLQAVCLIDRIEIYNRLDFKDRLRHFSILMSDDGLHWELAHKKVDDSVFGGADGLPFVLNFSPARAARFIKVQQDDLLFLHFDEFRAFGRRLPARSVDIQPVQADMSVPRLRGRAEVDFVPTADASHLGLGVERQVFCLFPSTMPPAQLPMRTNIVPPPIIMAEHDQYHIPPPVCAYAVPGGQIWGSGVVTIDSRFLVLPDCLPGYFAGSIDAETHGFDIPVLLPENWARREYLRSDVPLACVVNPNMVYGHFLLEMLPRLYVLSVLRRLGARFNVALPFSAPGWVRPFVDLYFPRREQIWYGTASQILQAPSVILPSMMHVEHNFHPAFNFMISDLRARVGLRPVPGDSPRDPRWPRRIYLSRRLLEVNKRLENEDEIEALMERLGFMIVHPQALSLRDQLSMFDSAEVVAGEYSSALHNTMFCRPGTRIIALDFYSWYQSALGRLRQQPHCFVAPDDGRWRHWRLLDASDRHFRVDPKELEAMVRDMVPETAPA